MQERNNVLCWTSVLAVVVVLGLLLCRLTRLLDRALTALARRFVGAFEAPGSALRLNISFWQGYAEIKDLQLDCAWLDALDGPFRTRKASVDSVKLRITWWHWQYACIDLLISGVNFECGVRNNPTPIAAAAFQAEQAAAHAHARAAKLAAIDSVLWDCRPFRRGGAKACRSLARHAGYQLISRLTVDVQNVSVAFKLDAPIASLAAAANFVPSGVWNPRTAGTEGGSGSSAAATPESTAGNAAAPLPRAVRFSPDEPLGSCARLLLRSLTVNSATPHGYGVLATVCQLSGVDLAVDRPHAAGTPGERLHMVRRWSAHAAVDWRIASRMLDLHRQVGVTPVIQVNVQAAALLVRCNAYALQTLLSTAASFINYAQFYSYRRVRPQVGPGEVPRLWWQHAACAVLHERRLLAAAGGTCYSTARAGERRMHQHIYKRSKGGLSWPSQLLWLLVGSGPPPGVQLTMLERSLSLHEVALCRWRAWARHSAGWGLLAPRAAAANAEAKLDDVLTILQAQGTVRSSRTRPRRAELTLRCPKLSVMLQAPTSSAAAYVPVFEASLEQMCLGVTAGTQAGEQLQSGAGPLTLQATCQSLRVVSAPLLPGDGGQASSKVSMSAGIWAVDERPQMPLLECPTGRAAPKLSQAFLAVSYARPALQLPEPNVLRVDVAPVNVAYSQACFSSVLAFVDAAWPDAAYDPLRVLASVTLANTVQERLAAPAALPAVRLSSKRLQLEASIGTVVCTVPCSRQQQGSGIPAAAAQAPAPDSIAAAASCPQLVLVIDGFRGSSASHTASTATQMHGSALRGTSNRSLQRLTSFDKAPPAEPTADPSAPGQVGNASSATQQRVSPTQAKPRASILGRLLRNSTAVTATAASTSASSAGLGSPQHRKVHRRLRGQPETQADRPHSIGKRTGATRYEQLFLGFSLEAYLLDEGSDEPDPRIQLVDVFKTDLHVQHCFEPVDQGRQYRRVVAARLATLDTVVAHASEYISCQLCAVADLLQACARDAQTAAFPSSPQDDKDLDGNPRVFALQLAVQQITLNLMPTPSHMHADEEQGCFALTLQQARLQAAVEDGVTDIRFDVSKIGVDDLTPAAPIKHVLLPLPSGCGCAGTVSRQAAAFQLWRQHSLYSSRPDPKWRRRRLSDMPQHVGSQPGAQLQGHITFEEGATTASVCINVLPLSLDSGLLRRMATLSANKHIRSQRAAAMQQQVDSAAGTSAAGHSTGGSEPTSSGMTSRSSFRLAVDCGHVDMLVAGTRLATLQWQELQVSGSATQPAARDQRQATATLKSVRSLSRPPSAPSMSSLARLAGSMTGLNGAGAAGRTKGGQAAGGAGNSSNDGSCSLMLSLQDWQLLDHLASTPAQRCAVGSNSSAAATPRPPGQPPPPEGEPRHGGMRAATNAEHPPVPRSVMGNSVSILLVRQPQPSAAMPQSRLTKLQLSTLGSTAKSWAGTGSDVDSAAEVPLSRRPSARSTFEAAAPGQEKTCTLVQVRCERLHATLLYRFLADLLHLHDSVVSGLDDAGDATSTTAASMLSSVPAERPVGRSSAQPPLRDSPDAQPPTPILLEAAFVDMRLDVPRCSGSAELLSFTCASATVVAPAAAEYTEDLMPSMERLPNAHDLRARRMAYSKPASGSDWHDVVSKINFDQHSTAPWAFRRPSHRDIHELAPPLATDHQAALDFCLPNNLQTKFDMTSGASSWAARLGTPKLYWMETAPGGVTPAMHGRQVVDGSDAGVIADQLAASIRIMWPWMHLLAGQAQYELITGFCWENMEELSSFAPCSKPMVLDEHLQMPQPTRLGVDITSTPRWEVDFQCNSVAALAERRPKAVTAAWLPGCGPDVARLRARRLRVLCGLYPCGGLRIQITSDALLLLDTRSQQVNQQWPVVMLHSQQDLATDAAEAAAAAHQARPVRPPRRRHTIVNQLRQNVNTFTTPGDASADDTREEEPADGTDDTAEDGEVWQDNFRLEYVLQPPPATRPDLRGPHVMEVVVREVQLQWPYLLQMGFLWDLLTVYCTCVFVPWASTFREERGETQWMYFNILFENSELQVPFPKADSGHVMGSTQGSPQFVPDRGSMDGSRGLVFRWDTLRLLYFFGGNGEARLRIDTHGVSSTIRVPADSPQAAADSYQEQLAMRPFNGNATVGWHTPKHDPEARRSVDASITVRKVQLQPAFSQTPQYLAAMHALSSSMMQYYKTQARRQPSALHLHKRASHISVRASVASVAVVLVDDRHQRNIEVVQVWLHKTGVRVKVERTLETLKSSVDMSTNTTMKVLFLNSAVDAMDPLMEEWPLTLQLHRSKDAVARMTLHSEEILNVNITPSAFRSIGDVLAFVQQLTVRQAGMSRNASNASHSTGRGGLGAPKRSDATTVPLYRLVNRSGLRVSYWARSGVGAGQLFMLDPWEEAPLAVIPSRSSVVLPQTQQQVSARTICMQFEGHSTAVADIVVDAVGKYAYTISSPHTEELPVIMDVALEERTKVLTVHSNVRIENHTSHALQFSIHVLGGRGAVLAAVTGTTISVPGSGSLAPGLQCYLPIAAARDALMYVQAVGWQMARKDKIDLDSDTLHQKQGLYTCPPTTEGQKAFHCCLQLQEELINVLTPEGALMTQPEYVLRFKPPLTISNLLPFDMTVIITDSSSVSSAADPVTFRIGTGGRAEVYSFDLTRKLRMAIHLQEFKSARSVIIHYPTVGHEGMLMGLQTGLPARQLAKDITLYQTLASKRITLELHSQVDAGCKSREVSVSAPYWLLNKTDVPLQCKDTMPHAATPQMAAPSLGGLATPLLFSSSRGSMRLRVGSGSWSPSINLEKIGVHGTISVLGPPMPRQQSLHASRRWMAPDASEVTLEEYEHVALPRKLAERNPDSRRGVSMDLRSVIFRASMAAAAAAPESEEDVFDHQMAQPPELPSDAVGGGLHCGLDLHHWAPGHKPEQVSRYEFSVSSRTGPAIFHRTKVLTVLPRYVISNQSETPLDFAQVGSKMAWRLPSGDVRHPWHWSDVELPRSMCVRIAKDGWRWSGAFQMLIGDFGLRMTGPDGSTVILPVDISLSGASYLCIIGAPNRQPPYRIDNRCQHVKVKFQQAAGVDVDANGAAAPSVWEEVEPGATLDYAWDEPQAARRLRCVLEGHGLSYRDSMHQYSLDEIRVYPPIKLKKANMRLDRFAGKVVTGAGSAAKSVRRIVSRIGSAPDGAAITQPGTAGGSSDSDVRLVYVSTHAEGVTRVLCFSDTKDQYTRDAYAEDAAGLTRRLAQLDEHLQEVNAELDQLEDSSNLDMSLITNATPRRHQRSPSLTSRLSATLSTRSSTSDEISAIAGEAALATRLRRASIFGASELELAPREGVSAPGAPLGPRRVPSFLRTSMHRLGLRTMSMQADTSSIGAGSESSTATTPQPSGPLPQIDVVTPRLSVLLTPDTLPEETRPRSAPGGARGASAHHHTASISEEGDGREALADQPGSPRLDSISMPVPALRPRTAPPAAPTANAAVRTDAPPSPFVRWAALQRAASDSVNVQNASLDPAAHDDAATAPGSASDAPALSPGASADGGSSGASSVRLSPATQGLVLPKFAGGSAGNAAPADDMPATSLAAAFQAVASPLLHSPAAGSSLPETATPHGAAYDRKAYAGQPTVWSSPGTTSDAASPAYTLSPLPSAQQHTQDSRQALPPALRHGHSSIWEGSTSVRPQHRRTVTSDDVSSSRDTGNLARLPSQPRTVVPEAIAALGAPQHGAGTVATIPEASPVPSPPQPRPVAAPDRQPMRLSNLRAPSHERVSLAVIPAAQLDARRLSAMGRAIAASTASGMPRDSGELLGGELHVRIISGSNVLDALVHRQRTLTSESRQLKAMVRAAKLEVYCIVEVEGQQRRTVPVAGASDVLWNEELTFKTVRSTADLRVAVYARMRLGSDAFLGEVVIPLQEAARFGTMRSEVRRYTLGRRTTKEKVSGDIALGCRWRVSPLDVLALQVRGRQEELDYKQELVAIIKDWQPGSVAPSQLPQPKSCDGAGAANRWGGARGRLEVRIIEARNLTFGSGVLNKFHTLNTFAVASCNDDAGTLPYATRPISRSLTPHWDELAVFKDVAPTDRLHISVLDRRLMGPHLLLGQVKVGVHEFADGRPHYAWLPLEGRAAAGSVGGEVHLRMQWRENECEADAEATAKFSFEVDLQGIGVSVIEASVTKLAREVMHVQLRRVHADYRLSASNQSMRFALTDMQVDNQLLTSSQPVVLARARHASTAGQETDEEQAMHARRPFLEIRAELLNNNNILHFSSISVVQQEVDVALEEDFNEAMLAMLRDLPMQDIYQVASSSTPRRSFLDDQLDGDSALRSLLDASLESFNTRTRRERKIYFEKLDVAAIRCNLTLIPRPGQRAETDPATMGAVSRFRLANVFGIHFSDVHALPLRIGSLQLSHAFMTLNQLTSQIGRHLLWTAIHEMHKILGQVDILGSPIVLANSLLAGGRAFLAEPAKARTPKEFARGVAAGTASLFRNGAFGALVAFGQLTGGLGKGLAVLSMDEEFIGRFRSAPADAQARMLHGLQSFGVGLLEGCTGVLKSPLAGYRDGGLVGAGRGVLLGCAGLLLKPAAGGLELTSKTFSGLGIVVREAGLEAPPPPRSRARPPRQFGVSGCAGAGASGGMRRWQAVVESLEGVDTGNSRAVVDALQTKQGKATVFMADTLLYVDMRRRRLRWSIKLPHLTTVSTHGLVVVVHHSIRPSGRLFEWCDVRLPARRRVACASRETAQALNAKLNRALAARVAAEEAAGDGGLGVGGERPSADTLPPHNASDLHIMHRSAPKDRDEEDELVAGGSPRGSGMADGGGAAEAGGTLGPDAAGDGGGLLPSSETVGMGVGSAGRHPEIAAADVGTAAPAQQQQEHSALAADMPKQAQPRQAGSAAQPEAGSATIATAAAALQLQAALRTLLLLCDCAGSGDRQTAADTLISMKMLADATSMKVHDLGLPAAAAKRASAVLSSVAAMCTNVTAEPAARVAGVRALCGAHLALEPGG